MAEQEAVTLVVKAGNALKVIHFPPGTTLFPLTPEGELPGKAHYFMQDFVFETVLKHVLD